MRSKTIWWVIDRDNPETEKTIIWTASLSEAKEALEKHKKNLSREERENIEVIPISTSRKYFNKK